MLECGFSWFLYHIMNVLFTVHNDEKWSRARSLLIRVCKVWERKAFFPILHIVEVFIYFLHSFYTDIHISSEFVFPVSSHFTLLLISFPPMRFSVLGVVAVNAFRSSDRISIFHSHSFSAFLASHGYSYKLRHEKSEHVMYIMCGKCHFKGSKNRVRMKWDTRAKSRATSSRKKRFWWEAKKSWKW